MKIVTHPEYIKSGTRLTLICQSDVRTTIGWVKQTAESGLMVEEDIDPQHRDFVVQSCTDEPSGFTKSTLFRSNMSLNSRGWYKCKNSDGSSTYQTHVTVLYGMLITLVCFGAKYSFD